jgi:hypothetical protein
MAVFFAPAHKSKHEHFASINQSTGYNAALQHLQSTLAQPHDSFRKYYPRPWQ